MSNPIRVLIVDDHPLMRQALRTAIDVEPDMHVVGEASNGQEAVEGARQWQPDVTIMDLLMPGKDGLQAIAEIRAENPQARILALTSSTDEDKIAAALDAGAQGYLLKDTQREQLLQAIREVYQGNAFLPPTVARKFLNHLRRREPSLVVEPLTARELDVLKLIGTGASNKEIAQSLSLSEATVRVHVHNILGKLGFEKRSQAIAYALREKIGEK
jgi:NarL family two-component system response regulator LiaR